MITLRFPAIPVKTLIFLGILFILAGCASVGRQNSQGGGNSSASTDAYIGPSKLNITHELVVQGIEYLREGDYESAQKVFSASIKVSPNSSTLHLLNGISYHLQYLNNSPDNKELAETAYRLSASLDKSDTLPLIQMGRLHIDSGEYSKASKDFISAYAISPSSQDALFGLLQASLWQKDFKTALWAGDNLKKLNTSHADQLRLLSLMYAMVGKTTEANETFTAYQKVNSDNPKQVAQLKQQLTYLSTQLSGLKSQDSGVDQSPASYAASGTKKGQMTKVVDTAGVNSAPNSSAAKNAAASIKGSGVVTDTAASIKDSGMIEGAAAYKVLQGSSGSSSDSSGSSNTPMPGSMPSASSAVSGGGGSGGAYTAVSMSAQQQRWFDCDTKPGLGKAPGGSYGVPVGGTNGDQTLYLEPLPSPCDKKNPPKMATIDAVLIRTLDSQSSSYGINLLNGLTAFAGAQSFNTTATFGRAEVSGTVQNSVIGLGTATSAAVNSISGLVNYSLNIANSTTNNAEVIARPTLTALDRIPSTFYSGNVLTAGLNGGGVSGAQVTNIPTGVSLSITPTFIDDDSMMLAVKVSRSYVASTQAVGGFNAGVGTEQHAVTANVRIKYGETLILDGLATRQKVTAENGVPVLQDIPIIQYLFNNKQKSLYSENVIVLVTPRRMQNFSDDAMKIASNSDEDKDLTPKEKAVHKSMKIYKAMISGSDSNLQDTLLALDRDSSYFRSFSSAALNGPIDSWVTEPRIYKFLDDAANMIYFTR